jgi:hypothetical protein
MYEQRKQRSVRQIVQPALRHLIIACTQGQQAQAHTINEALSVRARVQRNQMPPVLSAHDMS